MMPYSKIQLDMIKKMVALIESHPTDQTNRDYWQVVLEQALIKAHKRGEQ